MNNNLKEATDVSRDAIHNGAAAPLDIAPASGANIDLADPFEINPAVRSENGNAATYGGQVSPKGPRQDMYAIDNIQSATIHDRKDSPAAFTGGDTETGLGGMANPQSTGESMSGTVHDDTGI